MDPADGGVGAVPRAEEVVAGVDAEPLDDRAVDDCEDTCAAEAGRRADEVEQRVQHRLGCGEHNREVVGKTTSHHRVGGQLLHGDHSSPFRHRAHHLISRTARGVDGPLHELDGRRHDWKVVVPSEPIARLDRLDRSSQSTAWSFSCSVVRGVSLVRVGSGH